MYRLYAALLLLQLICLPVAQAQLLPEAGTSADAVNEDTLQRYLQLSFDLSFNQPDQALLYGRKALAISRLLQLPDEEAQALENVGYVYFDRSALDTAEIYFSKALRISKSTGNAKGQSDGLNALGQVYFRWQAYAKALNHYMQALRILQQEGIIPGRAGVYNNIALVYKNLGDYPKATENLLKALELNEESGDKRKVSLNLSNLGLFYKEMNSLPQALEALQKALAIAREIDNNQMAALALLNLGLVHKMMGDQQDTLYYTQAWSELTEAAKLSEKTGNSRYKATAYNNLSNIALARKKVLLSRELINRSISLKKEAEDNQSLTYGYIQKAAIAQESGMLPEALLYARKAVQYANRYGHLVSRKDALARYAAILAESKQYAKAYQVLLQFKAVSDSLLNEQKARSVAQAEVAYETDKKQHEIERLEQEKQGQQQRAMYFMLACLLIGAGGAFFILLQRKRLLLKRQENALQQLTLQKNILEQVHLKEKLESYTRQLIKSNEAVLQLQEQLALTNHPAAADNNASINELISLKVLREDDWEHFKHLFNTVYPSFFLSLKIKHPTFSANDIRLAAMFRLGLNTREMAGALGVETESVKKARYRLRKKLVLHPEQDMHAYFSAL
ncbi:tetratricopeptide repeat protein [Pontibacter sp. 172403-2]|uniref:tetratricopeptide repeat protein n=1 Tax=Pontibacter rufus TaxID=2791028 RepID=UPI0018AF9BC1|nr:tetratricopeptide repeat protein [Pontibacter sp. 172403-2]MBF9252715.1 tetratricopeptide repeat protein [Pontibacter sp. 172403-2]